MSKLAQLKQFIEKQEIKDDPYWKSIFNSDIRNIFPKYELSKIQIMKNKVSKIRLIMENLEKFLYMQIYQKNMDDISKNLQEKQVKAQLEGILADVQKGNMRNSKSNYDFDIINKRDEAELISSELSKPKINEKLQEEMMKSQKWKQYLQSHTKQAQKYDKSQNQKDKIYLAKTINLKMVNEELDSTSEKILKKRVQQQVIKERIQKLMWKEDCDLVEEITRVKQDKSDFWSAQWLEVLEKLKKEEEEVEEK